ncbi:hypothetical protein VRRI112168_02555 [Vreelandella rituensis]|uniref:DNA helicase n=1 Tax=Vreelandella rituensis TaxID=2282306 RepID=A0A368U9K1_9GAMM|nr:hypothetical protein [Halomonas rituensis]RCV93625.1 hypothetical protein DU506_00275 [Halomonas rituensis]
MKLSTEQKAIIEHITRPLGDGERAVQGGHLVNVPAVAGSGKSLVIVEFGRRAGQADILFLAQSRNVVDRARGTLPSNVTARTVYEMAVRHVRLTHKDKLKTPAVLGGIPRQQIKARFPHVTSVEIERALGILTRFYQTKGSFPEPMHLPDPDPQHPDWRNHEMDRKQAVSVARDIWFSQASRDPESLPLTFDAIIKLWTLSTAETVTIDKIDRRITLSPLGKHDIVILEEAQDSSEALLDFIARQRVSIITFGDPFQALRPGNLAIQQLRHPLHQRADTIFMGESYRFGPAVAGVLNALTHKAGSQHKNRITGLGTSSLHGAEQRFTWLEKGLHYTHIADQPASLFLAALEATRWDKRIAWVDGISSYPVQLLLDLARLGAPPKQNAMHQQPPPIQTPWVRQCASLDAAHQYASQRNDALGMSLCNLVANHLTPTLPDIIQGWISDDHQRQQAMLKHWSAPPARDITLTTVIRAKGHEFPRVMIDPDLAPPHLFQQWAIKGSWRRAIHRLYTALSRTQFAAAVPDVVLAHLDAHQWPRVANPSEDTFDDLKDNPHPHFGIHRHTLLEMTPAHRDKRCLMAPAKKTATTASGHTSTRERLEANAKALEGTSVEELRQQLPMSRARRNRLHQQ